MGSLNKVMLIGNLGADPEVRQTPGGQSVATLRLATNEVWKDRDGDQAGADRVASRDRVGAPGRDRAASTSRRGVRSTSRDGCRPDSGRTSRGRRATRPRSRRSRSFCWAAEPARPTTRGAKDRASGRGPKPGPRPADQADGTPEYEEPRPGRRGRGQRPALLGGGFAEVSRIAPSGRVAAGTAPWSDPRAGTD